MEHRKRSSPPRGMPAEAPRPRKGTLHGRQKPDDPLPEQQPVTDDEPAPKKPSRLRLILLRVAVGVLLVIALVVAYLFLLLGEPDEEAKYVDLPDEELITMPMGALEIPGEANLQNLANTFGQPVMALYGGPALERARVYDTAFGGGYARRVTLTYAFDDGTQLTVESIRPTSAITLLGSGYSLSVRSLYALGGLDAARMDGGGQICIFGQSDTAAYAVLCPEGHESDLNSLLRQTTLIAPEGE